MLDVLISPRDTDRISVLRGLMIQWRRQSDTQENYQNYYVECYDMETLGNEFILGMWSEKVSLRKSYSMADYKNE